MQYNLHLYPTDELFEMWDIFKKARVKNEYLGPGNEEFIPMQKREALIDELFYRINNPEET